MEVLRDETLTIRVHGDHDVVLRRQHVRLPGADGEPDLSVVRSAPLGGSRRPSVILVHGFAQNRYTWEISGRSLVGFLADAGYETWNLELRGHGLSRELGAGNARRFEEYVSDVRRLVEALPQKPILMGHSLGGGAIVGAASEVPVAGVVHVCGLYSFGQHNRTIRGLARASLGLEKRLPLAPVRGSTGWAGRLIGGLYGFTDLAGYGLPLAGWVPGSMERDLLEERLRLGFDWTSLEVWLQMCRWARGAPFQWAEAWRSTDVPLLVIAGDADALLPPGDARRCFDESGSTAKEWALFEAWEHGAHFGHLDILLGKDAPRVVWPRMRAFFDTIR